ncbi:MAG: hypothetical protein WB565_03825 [Acidimicrobiales bacterium]
MDLVSESPYHPEWVDDLGLVNFERVAADLEAALALDTEDIAQRTTHLVDLLNDVQWAVIWSCMTHSYTNDTRFVRALDRARQRLQVLRGEVADTAKVAKKKADRPALEAARRLDRTIQEGLRFLHRIERLLEDVRNADISENGVPGDSEPPGHRVAASPHRSTAPPCQLVAPRVGELMAA